MTRPYTRTHTHAHTIKYLAAHIGPKRLGGCEVSSQISIETFALSQPHIAKLQHCIDRPFSYTSVFSGEN